MLSGVKSISLGEYPVQIIDGDRGKNYPKTEHFQDFGHCLFLNAGNVTSDGFAFDKISFISKERDDLLRNGKLERNDVVLTTRGTVGNLAFYDSRVLFDHVRINSGMVIFRADTLQVLPKYLFYALRSPVFSKQVKKLTTGSAQPQFPIRDIKSIKLLLPNLKIQHVIVAAIGAFDDKIELNRQINETLEAMAQAIFKDWFVDFGPVRRKQSGETDSVKILGGLIPDSGRAASIAALFPDRLGGDGLPVGWDTGFIDTMIDLVGGGTPKTSKEEYWNGEIPWFSVKDTPAGSDCFVFTTEKSITSKGLNNCSAKLVPKGTSIISARGTIGNLVIAGQDMAFNQSCYAVRPADGQSAYFTYLALQKTVENLRSMAHGSVFSTITRATFQSVVFPQFPDVIVSTFEKVVTPFFDLIFTAVQENQTLAETRDYLLPKLMSGEVRVKDTAKTQ